MALMLAMFLGASIPLMEKRSLERRPDYQSVIATVPMLLPRPPRKAAPVPRFRDGALVATNGAKYVVEDLTKAWDGGSSGKVYTKGKRGPGVRG